MPVLLLLVLLLFIIFLIVIFILLLLLSPNIAGRQDNVLPMRPRALDCAATVSDRENVV